MFNECLTKFHAALFTRYSVNYRARGPNCFGAFEKRTPGSKLAQLDFILLWYGGLSFDLRFINKIYARRENTGLTVTFDNRKPD